MRLLTGLIFVFSGISAWACTYTTSTTTKASYEIVNEAKTRALLLCVDDKKFYTYELENILKAGARLKIYVAQVDFYTYELENMARVGNVAILVGTKKYYSYEVENLIKAGVQVQMRTSETSYYAYEFVNMAKRGNGRAKLILHVDDNRLAEYEIENIRKAGAIILRN